MEAGRGALFIGFAKAFFMLSGFLQRWLLTRFVGPAEYGAYGSSEGRGPWGGRWSRDEAPAASPYDQRSEFAHLPPGRARPPAAGPTLPRASGARPASDSSG